MRADIVPGKYILAVSGGVDSMALLHLLAQKAIVNSKQLTVDSPKNRNKKDTNNSTSSIELVVAHFNHGIRPDSVEDEKLVSGAAQKYNLPIEVGYGKLGANASEEQARNARYGFLNRVKKKHQADAIITAHHQDDLIETAMLNILRGTNRRGLSSIRSQSIRRPLLDVPKKAILAYAKKNKLQWREDETNTDTKYFRNYVRQKIMPGLTIETRTKIVKNLDKVAKLNLEIDNSIATLSHVLQNNKLDRHRFIMLPTQVADELLTFWLKKNDLGKFDSKTVKRLSISLKTGLPGTKQPVYGVWQVRLDKRTASLVHP